MTRALVLALAVLLAAPAVPAKDRVEDLLWDLQIVPLDGKRARPFKLATLDGKPLALGDLKGRPVLLYFWATW